MNSINSFKDPILAKKLLATTRKLENRPPISLMEVCGSHTMSIYKNGIDKLLPSYINLLSGPGCPVCVTDTSYIDQAILLSKSSEVIIATFGDMIRVPGSSISLSIARAQGADVKVVYSPLDCISLAKLHPDKEIVFLGVGFETTAPSIALLLKEAAACSIRNLSLLLSLKTMPYAMENLIFDECINIDGFICPGHVAAIIGSEPFDILARKYGVPMVIAGFECVDLVGAIHALTKMIDYKNYSCQNLYKRVVKPHGNIKALSLLKEVFEEDDSSWRGLGIIPKTGLSLRSEYNSFNAQLKFNLTLPDIKVTSHCMCDKVLKGIKKPIECPLYKTNCTPATPIGACMVSSEGTCMNFYKYNN